MIAIVGSRDLWPIPSVASAVLNILISNPGEVFAIRCNREKVNASGTEDLVERIAARLHMNTIQWPPQAPTHPAGGRSQTYLRDTAMVARCWAVHAFFSPGELMSGGTGHVAAVALRAGISLTAYSIDNNARVYVVAEDEGDLLRMWQE